MKKIFLLALLLATALFLSGCFINITAMTKINDDGSGFRITTYTADGASEKEELIKNYGLPSGGEWRLNNYVKDAAPEHVYEIKRAFTDLNSLKPDYIRRGRKAGNVSANNFSLKIKRGILFNAYEYEETFRDCTDARKISDYCGRWYDRSLDISAAEIEKAFPRTVEKQKVKALLDERYRPYYDYFISAFLKGGWRIFNDSQQKVKEYEEKYNVESFSAFLADYIISLDKGADRKAVMEKLKAVHEKINEQFSDNSSLSDPTDDDAFGVYGWPMFMGYSFDISVILPGRIIEANTKDIKGNFAKWEFSNDDFLLNEYSLKAKSRKLNPAGIGILSVFFLIALFIAYRMGNKRN